MAVYSAYNYWMVEEVNRGVGGRSDGAFRPTCPSCSGPTIRYGKTAAGRQRYRCRSCLRTTTEASPRSPIHPMRIPLERAVLCLRLLVEGSSIRTAERITGTHRDTIGRLVLLAGGRCERLLAELVRNVPVHDVETSELWAFVGMKEMTKERLGVGDSQVGDAYAFLAMERESKLVLAWHLGRRTGEHADAFAEKLDRATAGRFQLTTSGLGVYREAVSFHLGTRTDYSMLVREVAPAEGAGDGRRSPPRIVGMRKERVHGDPDPVRACTSHAERGALTFRMQSRRFARRTNAFSKSWRHHRAGLALQLAYYNLCWMHSSIRMTPAMKAGVARRPWRIEELLAVERSGSGPAHAAGR